MFRSRSLIAVMGFAVLTSVNALAADALPTETFKVLTVDLALEAAQAAIAACKSQGYAVTVTVAEVRAYCAHAGIETEWKQAPLSP